MGSFYVRKKNYHPGMEAKVFSWNSTHAHPRNPGKCDRRIFPTVHPPGGQDTLRWICLSIFCERLWEAVYSSSSKRIQIREKKLLVINCVIYTCTYPLIYNVGYNEVTQIRIKVLLWQGMSQGPC